MHHVSLYWVEILAYLEQAPSPGCGHKALQVWIWQKGLGVCWQGMQHSGWLSHIKVIHVHTISHANRLMYENATWHISNYLWVATCNSLQDLYRKHCISIWLDAASQAQLCNEVNRMKFNKEWRVDNWPFSFVTWQKWQRKPKYNLEHDRMMH